MAENQSCSHDCSSCQQRESGACSFNAALKNVKHQIVVLSGKGGVGKSTVSVNLAYALALEGYKVGLLDVDIHGPSIPKMLHLEDARPEAGEDSILPVQLGDLKVMSIGLLLESPDDPIIWRGPAKIGVIKQFLSEVEWGELDYLVIDTPPGTGDEPLTVCQMLLSSADAVVVTTPQDVAAADVAKSLNFCDQLGFSVLGLVENMSGFVCPKCGEVTEIFSQGGGEKLAQKFNLPLLGKIPLDPRVCQCGDAGRPVVLQFSDSPMAAAYHKIATAVIKSNSEEK